MASIFLHILSRRNLSRLMLAKNEILSYYHKDALDTGTGKKMDRKWKKELGKLEAHFLVVNKCSK